MTKSDDHHEPRNGLSRRSFVSGIAGAAGVAALAGGTRSFASQPDDPNDAFNYALPYPSRRQPVFAKNVVSTSQPLAAQAGLEMLRRGGNAMDAAVATAAALTVVEPCSNGIGSDNFALVWNDGEVHGMNASGHAPQGLQRDRWEGMESIPTRGWDGVTTPGAVSGWVAMNKKFGSMSLAEVLAPAVDYARHGYLVSPDIARSWRGGARAYSDERFAGWQHTFLRDGRAPETGELYKSEDHANTLQAIGETGGDAFYKGDIARAIDAAARAEGGDLRLADLEAHQADWVDPIHIDYHRWRLHEIPPNGQGITALIALGILRHFDMRSLEVDSVESLHIQIEAMKLAFRDAHRYVADPRFMDVSNEQLLAADYLESRAALINRNHATDFDHGAPKDGGTVLLTTADAQGNMVSFIQSNYTGFGSGVVVKGTGVSLQNRGCCFTLEKGHPNEAAPGKRPYHTIIPAFVTREGPNGQREPVMAYGVMGGYMQPQGHAQVLVRMADYDQNPQAALDAPRWQVHSGLTVSIEPHFDPSVYEGLAALGHDLRRRDTRNAGFGRGQVIYKLRDGYVAGSDLRADGQAVGF